MIDPSISVTIKTLVVTVCLTLCACNSAPRRDPAYGASYPAAFDPPPQLNLKLMNDCVHRPPNDASQAIDMRSIGLVIRPIDQN